MQEQVDLVFAVMLVHRVDDFVEAGVVDQFAGRINAVKVRTEADMFDTGLVYHVIEMGDDLIDCRVIGTFL